MAAKLRESVRRLYGRIGIYTSACIVEYTEKVDEMTWNLRSSQSDRIAYYEMAHESGKASAIVLNDEDLENSDARQVAREVFEADLGEDRVDVDDVDEARARWISAFVAGYREEQSSRRMENDEEVA